MAEASGSGDATCVSHMDMYSYIFISQRRNTQDNEDDMCSGCFGDYDDAEEDSSDDRAGDVFADAVVDPAGSGIAPARGEGVVEERFGCPEDQYEVLVGGEYIVEIRLLKASPLGEGHLDVAGRACRGQARSPRDKQLRGESAKYYRTPTDLRCASDGRRFPGWMRMLTWFLAIVLASGVAAWLARA